MSEKPHSDTKLPCLLATVLRKGTQGRPFLWVGKRVTLKAAQGLSLKLLRQQDSKNDP